MQGLRRMGFMPRYADDFIVQSQVEQVFRMRTVKGYYTLERLLDHQGSSGLIDNFDIIFNRDGSGQGFLYAGAVNRSKQECLEKADEFMDRSVSHDLFFNHHLQGLGIGFMIDLGLDVEHHSQGCRVQNGLRWHRGPQSCRRT